MTKAKSFKRQKTSLLLYGRSFQQHSIYLSMLRRVFFLLLVLSPYSSADEPSVFSGFAPMIGTIETGSGLAAGIRYQRSIFQAAAAYSTGGYRHFELQIGKNAPKRGLFLRPIRYEFEDVYDLPSVQTQDSTLSQSGPVIYFEYRYRNLTEVDYFGPGAASLDSNHTNYNEINHAFEFVTGYQISSRLRLDFRAGYSFYEIDHGHDADVPDITRLFDDQTAPGLTKQPDFFHIGPAVLIDHRNTPGDPESGWAAGFSFTHFEPSHGKFRFQRFLIDTRYFVPLHRFSSVAAFWFHTSLDSNQGENQVPFYLQRTLGGSRTLRGFDDFRFQGPKQVYLSFEYRWNVLSSLQLAAFYDTGKVFETFSDFDLNSLERGVGCGLRIKAKGGVVFRMDYGHSNEDNRIVFRFSPAF
jgi:Omp85 superfamily domain